MKKRNSFVLFIVLFFSILSTYLYHTADKEQFCLTFKNLVNKNLIVYDKIEVENKINTIFTNRLSSTIVSLDNKDLFYELLSYPKMKMTLVSDEKLREDIIMSNSPKRLLLIDSYGYNDAYHPKVISFDSAWHGYKYWLVYSPFPSGNEKYENPHLKISNDLVNWQEPVGFINPIENIPENFSPKKVYNSDPHILYNKDQDQLEVWWRFVNDFEDKVTIFRSISKNGVDWSDKQALIIKTRSEEDYISPAVIYEDGLYKVWYIRTNRIIAYMESKDLKNWQNERTIDMQYQDGKLKDWHLDVIHTPKGYEMVISAYDVWSRRNNMNLYYSCSEDNINYIPAITILKPAIGTDHWDNRGIYKSSLLYENNRYYLFYSASSTYGTEGIGLLSGDEITDLKYCKCLDY